MSEELVDQVLYCTVVTGYRLVAWLGWRGWLREGGRRREYHMKEDRHLRLQTVVWFRVSGGGVTIEARQVLLLVRANRQKKVDIR